MRSSTTLLKTSPIRDQSIYTRSATFSASWNRVRDFDRSRVFRATLRSVLDAPRLYLEQLWEPGRGGWLHNRLMGEARVRSNHGESERFYSLTATARYILSKRLSISVSRCTPILYTCKTPTTLTPINAFPPIARRDVSSSISLRSRAIFCTYV